MCNLNSSKASKDTDMQTKIFKTSADIFTYFIHSGFNKSLKSSVFLSF